MAKQKPLVDQLRRAIRDDGRSLYAVAKAAELRISPLQRFMRKEHGITADSADRLCEALGLSIRLVRRR